MAQIGQQDNLVIEITGAISAANKAIKDKLAQTVRANTALDVVLKSTTEGVSRVVGYTDDGEGNISVVYVNASTGQLAKLSVASA